MPVVFEEEICYSDKQPGRAEKKIIWWVSHNHFFVLKQVNGRKIIKLPFNVEHLAEFITILAFCGPRGNKSLLTTCYL